MAPQRSGRAARPDPVFDELVDESDYFSLPLLCQACHVDAGYQPTVSHMRRLLHDANNGTSEHIAALDKEEFRRQCAERRAERDAERAARAESLAAERRDDEARLARRDALRADMRELRLSSSVRHSTCLSVPWTDGVGVFAKPVLLQKREECSSTDV